MRSDREEKYPLCGTPYRLDEPTEPAVPAEDWDAVIRQRLEDIDAGEVKPVPWSEARERIFAAARGSRG
ncbi:MAG: addiction module protein [Polyangiaceae bacterium]|nr:addiction module protein [Polyangiaceae bacterium]